MLRVRSLLPAAFAAGAFMLLPGCSSTPSTPGEAADEVDWIDDPGSIRDFLAAVGGAPCINDLMVPRARENAVVQARAQLAATLKAKIESLSENWAKDVGDLLDERTISNYANNEALVRQLVNTELYGSRPVKYEQRGRNMYALVVLEDPQKWVHNVGNSLKDQALRDSTLFKTQVMKDEFEKKLDKLIERDANAAAEMASRFEQRFVK
jgi:hypothetical protein